MKQDVNFVKQWFNLGYKDDLSRFDEVLVLENLHVLVDATTFCVPALLLFAFGLYMFCQVHLLSLLPFLLVSLVEIVMTVFLWRVIRKPRSEDDPLPKHRWQILLFLSMLVALALYYDFYLWPNDNNRMLSLVFLIAAVLFDMYPLKNIAVLGVALAAFLTVLYNVTGEIAFTVQNVQVFIAVLVGLFLGYQKTRGTMAALLVLEQSRTDEIRAREVRNIISQLQPHFLYNTLASIQYLCRSDQQRAQTALGQFCSVMRGNMASVARRKKIPFEQELEHTKSYVDLEQLRFGDRLTVHYDIQATDFLIPALTLQSVVENSIKYGACIRKYGGIVMVTCKTIGKWVEITVSDNGTKRDDDYYRWQDRWEDHPNHVGLQTVQDRLQAVMEGELILTYHEGMGAVVTVRILKEEVERTC